MDQNFDSYAVEYTFDDSTESAVHGRAARSTAATTTCRAWCRTKGAGIVSMAGHTPGKVRTFNTASHQPQRPR
ncbi:MAG: hypothetical protein R3F11_03730 [Verrucomicrobiales bacterium]